MKTAPGTPDAITIPSKKSRLLQDANVKRWYDNLARGSMNTAEIALRRLSLYCELNKTTPKALAKLSAKTNFNLLCDTIGEREKEGKKGSYIDGIRKGVTSWLRFNAIKFDQNPKVRDAKISHVSTKTPEPHEVLEINAAGTSRTKVSTSLMAYSGLRPETLGNADGSDGLRLGDFPELALDPEPHFRGEPPYRVIVRSNLSKAGHQYFSYLNGKASEAIINYLRERQQFRVVKRKDNEKMVHHTIEGEKLTPGTPLLKSFGHKTGDGEFVVTPKVCSEIKRAIRRAGFNNRPYDLRGFFDSQLLIAENRGKIAHDFRVFWMGHTGSIEAVYTTNRHTLSDTILKEMRRAYTQSSPFLLRDMFDEEEMKAKIEATYGVERDKTQAELYRTQKQTDSLQEELARVRPLLAEYRDIEEGLNFLKSSEFKTLLESFKKERDRKFIGN